MNCGKAFLILYLLMSRNWHSSSENPFLCPLVRKQCWAEILGHNILRRRADAPHVKLRVQWSIIFIDFFFLSFWKMILLYLASVRYSCLEVAKRNRTLILAPDVQTPNVDLWNFYYEIFNIPGDNYSWEKIFPLCFNS